MSDKTTPDSKYFIYPQQHVYDGRKESLYGYVATFGKDLPPDGNGGVFALDCEMVSPASFYLLKKSLILGAARALNTPC